MTNLQDKLFEYLKKKLPEFTKTTKSGAILFTCVGENTRILMSDFSTKMIKDIKEGEQILSFTETGTPSLKIGKVLKKKFQGYKKVYKIKTEDNKILYVTPDHYFYSNTHSGNTKWRELDNLIKNKRKIISFKFDLINNYFNYNLGLFAGFFDADGYYYKNHKEHFGNQQMKICQKIENEFLEELFKIISLTYNKLEDPYKSSAYLNKNTGNSYTYHLHKEAENIYKLVMQQITLNNKDVMYGYVVGFLLGDGTIDSNKEGARFRITQKYRYYLLEEILKKLNIKYNIYNTKTSKHYVFSTNLPFQFYAPKSKKLIKYLEKQKLTINKLNKTIPIILEIIDNYPVWDIETDLHTYIAEGIFVHNCPNIVNHKFKSGATSTFMGNTEKISCLICGFKGTMFDAVRLLEPDKKNKSDAEITDYLIESMNLDMYKELNVYQVYGWSLTPLLKNDNAAFEDDWRNKKHIDKIRWIKWLNNQLNIGLNCELSGVMAVDIDCKKPPRDEKAQKDREEIINLLENSNTLKAKTPSGGFHYVFKWVEELRTQKTNLAGTQIDTRTEGQIAIAPSIRNGIPYTWLNLGIEIKKMPEELKLKLLELIKIPVEREIEISKTEIINKEGINTINEGEGRNTLLTSLGGAFINKFNLEDTAYILSMISRNFFKPPLPDFEIKAMIKSLGQYKISDEESHEKIIYEYMKLIQNDVSAKDIMESTGLKRAIIDKYLSKFVKEGKAIRLSRGRYQYREKIEWSDEAPEIINEYPYKIPFFNDIAIFQDRDVILLGARTNDGKTTIAMNIIKEIIKEGVKPFYIYAEAGSRFQKISQSLGITGKYYHTYHANPLAIELEPNSFSIIDWLHLEHKENTDTVLKHLNDELQRKGGILVVFTQLKQSYEWFAPNMIDLYPTFAAKYIQDNQEKTEGHFQCDKIKEPRGNFTTYILPCTYDHMTKIFKKKDLI